MCDVTLVELLAVRSNYSSTIVTIVPDRSHPECIEMLCNSTESPRNQGGLFEDIGSYKNNIYSKVQAVRCEMV